MDISRDLVTLSVSDPRRAAIIEAASARIMDGFPLSGIDIIRVKDRRGVERERLYINAVGLTWLVQHDDRGIIFIGSNIVPEWCDRTKGEACFKCILEFSTGARFEAFGFAQAQNSQSWWQVAEIAETRATNRAMRKATAQTLIAHKLDEIGENGMKLSDTRGAYGEGLDEITSLESLAGEPITVVGISERRRVDGSGMSRVLTVECGGKLSRHWCPSDAIYDQLKLAMSDSGGQELTGCVFEKTEVMSRTGKPVFRWSLHGTDSLDSASNDDIDDDKVPF